MPQALAVEMFHNFTLLHDDVMDHLGEKVESTLRTVHVESRDFRGQLHNKVAATAEWVIADEIYEHIRYNDQPFVSLASFPEIADRTVVINGVSKAYAMTGWRIGCRLI